MSQVHANAAVIATPDNVTLASNGRTYTVTRKYADANGIMDAIRAKDYDTAIMLADRGERLKQGTGERMAVRDGVVYYMGQAIHEVITERIVEFQETGLPYDALMKFLENKMDNPSSRSSLEGYKFLEHLNLPITSDGCFLAYKSLRADYRSKYRGSNVIMVSTDKGKTFQPHTGNIPNAVGSIVKVERREVDDDFRNECSYGLHVGCLEYAGPTGWYHSPGDKIVVVKVNPRDIVSVPDDHGATKMRVCEYEVVADFVSAYTEPLVGSTGEPVELDADPNDFDGEVCGDCGDYRCDGECYNEDDENADKCLDCGEPAHDGECD